MLQAARLAPRLLDEAVGLVHDFLWSQVNDDGGFKDRSGRSDLYYTVFGIDALLAIQVEPPLVSLARYLRTFGNGDTLDFVHLACLARCHAALPPDKRLPGLPERIAARLETFRSADGGYNQKLRAKTGTVYACFLAYGAYGDLGTPLPAPARLLKCVKSFRNPDGGYTNDTMVPLATTPSTAAALTLLRHLGVPHDDDAGNWLLQRAYKDGGFFATPNAPMPDLLSTAVALHALAGMGASLEKLKEPTLDFLDSLWTNRGGFHGNWSDDAVDCEYTYYALLALGHLG